MGMYPLLASTKHRHFTDRNDRKTLVYIRVFYSGDSV
jgi:hypothetical protein